MKLSNKVYDILKWMSLVALDAFGIFYSEMSAIWNFPFGDEVLKTSVSLSVFIGALIGISGINHAKKNKEGSGNAD